MLEQHPFTWRHFQVEIIRMSCRLVLALCAQLPRSRRDDPRTRVAGRSYDDLPLGAAVRARTGEALSTHLNANNDSWKVDETSLKIRKVCFSLSRAVDSTGDTLEFLHAPNTRCRGSKELLAQSLAVLGSFRFSSMPRPGTGHPAPSGIGLSRRSIGSSRDHWG
jgi:transposase, IS6 family